MISKTFVVILTVLLSSCSLFQHKPHLYLVNQYEVITDGSLEPSGLTFWDNHFYTISDKHDEIYKLNFVNDTVILEPFITIKNNRNTKLDFEGITHDEEYFYLISERYFQVMKVSKDGKEQSWISKSNALKNKGISVGLFQTNNANFEGICYLKDNEFLMVAERQPRGFVELNMSNASINAYQSNDSIFKFENGRSTDFTGLSCEGDVFALERNAYTIAKIKKINGKYEEVEGYNYSHFIKMEYNQYQDMKYGHAEGLVAKGGRFYIILDNNRSSRALDSQNKNSLFFEFELR